MSQNENNNPLGAMISQLLSNPQQMQQLQQMAASLGLGAPSSNEDSPQAQSNSSSSKSSTNPSPAPDLSSLIEAFRSSSAPQNTNPIIDSNMIASIQKIMQMFSQSNPNVDFLRALRPLLSQQRAKKIDDAIRIMQLIQALPLLKESGIFDFGGDSR